MKKTLLLLLLLLVGVTGAVAQNQSNAALPVVYGRDNPQAIPDRVAYRMVFLHLAVPANATPEEVARLYRTLSFRLHLSDREQKAVLAELQRFHGEYHSLIDNYNAQLNSGAVPDRNELHANRDNLVQRTRENLKAALSADSMARFDAYVQGEKYYMATQDTQP